MSDRLPSLQELIRRRQASGFVGRREQLGVFESNLGLPVDDARRRFLFCLHGSAGVGKSFLVRQFVRSARQREVLTAYVDESAYDVVTAIEAMVGELAEQGARCREFPGLVREYRQRRHELESDPATPEEVSSELTRTAVRVGLRMAGDLPLVGAVAEEIDPDAVAARLDRARAFLGNKFRSQEDVRLLLSPMEVLTTAFVRDLGAIADARPIALFFDTYERTGAFLELSGRLPVWVATLASAHPSTTKEVGDPSGDAVERFLKWEHDPRRRTAALNGAIPRTLDCDVFTLVDDDSEEEGRFGWLRQLPFVVEHPDGYRYHDVVRSAMLRVLRKNSSADWTRHHRALTDHYKTARDTLDLSGLDALKNQAWQLCDIEKCYHDLCGRGIAALATALGGLVDAIAWNPSLADSWTQMIAQAGRDSANLGLIRQVEDLPSPPGDDDNSPVELLTALIDHYQLDPAHQARALYERGDVNRRLERYEKALADYDRANQIDPNYARVVAYRGWVYHFLGRYDEALSVLDHAVELDSEESAIFSMRGVVYRKSGRYEEALANLDHAVELRPESAWLIANRGDTYRMLGRHEEALADLDHAIGLKPEYAWAVGTRGVTCRLLGRQAEAVADLDRAIMLEPEDIDWWHYQLALTLMTRSRTDEATARIMKAIAIHEERRNHVDTMQFNIVIYKIALGDRSAAMTDLERLVHSGACSSFGSVNVAIEDLLELSKLLDWDLMEFREILVHQLR